MPRDPADGLPVGTLVRFGWWKVGRHAQVASIVQHLGRSVMVQTHGCRGTTEAMRYQVRRITPQPDPAPFVSMRYALPYGIYLNDETGRSVLYNREYEPIWSRMGDAPAQACDPKEWVRYQRQEWFFNDGNPPWKDIKSMRRCLEVLASWGVERPVLTGVEL